MEPNKIMSADILDLLFDNRNKEYGAYELRSTYPKRVTKALLFTAAIIALAFGGTLLANSSGKSNSELEKEIIVQMTEIQEEIIEPPIEEPEVQPEPEQVATVQYVVPTFVDTLSVPPPTITDIDNKRIDVFTQTGIHPDSTDSPTLPTDRTGILDKPTVPNEPFRSVQVEAKFAGNWEKFLLRYLNPEVPVNNGAPAGRYTVSVEFIVDIEGNVSNIKPISTVGFGMEQEAVRVLQKAAKWQPAIQNGIKVKAYRTQRIIFEVLDGE